MLINLVRIFTFYCCSENGTALASRRPSSNLAYNFLRRSGCLEENKLPIDLGVNFFLGKIGCILSGYEEIFVCIFCMHGM
jgi:hypothetical protein